MKLLSTEHILSLFKLALPDEGKKLEHKEAKFLIADEVDTYFPKKEPSFRPLAQIDPKKPFGDLEDQNLFGSYVTRNDRDVAVLIEILDFNDDEGVVLGSAFTPTGIYIELSPDEETRIEKEFISRLPK